jgi:hypothetical protein
MYKVFTIIAAVAAVASLGLIGPMPYWGAASFATSVVAGIIAVFLWEDSDDNPNVRW